ncbi:3-methyl-2-oxobutanoate hydroxymethyltransferase [Bacillaceae bacterium SIJ1]|nr:3-methyl-2-oxobutanoate hydroxymethyltransferase [Litoribacterium kuwaitense]
MEPIVMLTAYDFPSASLAEDASVDIILVGDSLGMVVLGYESTIRVTVADMVHHARAVKRGAENTLIVVDMPYLTYHGSIEQTVETARYMMQETGAHALKLEGGQDICPQIETLVKGGVPIIGHLGLTPQSVGVLGGFRIQGKTADQAAQLLDDAKALERAGVSAIVIECVPAEVASDLTKALNIPVIGIGAGAETDGQVLVYHDVLNYSPAKAPSFAKVYDQSYVRMKTALTHFAEEVRTRAFPDASHSFAMTDDELKKWRSR